MRWQNEPSVSEWLSGRSQETTGNAAQLLTWLEKWHFHRYFVSWKTIHMERSQFCHNLTISLDLSYLEQLWRSAG